MKRGIALVIVVYLALALVYSVVVPIYEAPDEFHHAFYVQHLAQTRSLPVPDPAYARGWHEEGGPPRPYRQVWAQEGLQPPLYYAIGASLTGWIDTDGAEQALTLNPHANIGNPLLPGNKNLTVRGADECWPWRGMPLAVHLLRFFSIALGAGTIYLTYRLAASLFSARPAFALAAAGFVAFLPQFIFISAAVTNDNLIIFLATLMLYLLVRIMQGESPPGWARVLGVGLVLGLAMLTKLSGLSLLALTGVAFALCAIVDRRWGAWITRLGGVYLVAFVIAGWWYLRNWVMYADFTALGPFLSIVGPRPAPLTWASSDTEFASVRISLLGLFGWFNVPLPRAVYLLWDAFLLAAGAGLIVRVVRRPRPVWRRHLPLIVLATWIVLLTISLVRWTSLTPAAQGRLLFPAIAAIAIFVMLGWGNWLRARPVWLAIPPAALLALSVLSLPLVIAPAYRSPDQITPDAIPASARIEPIIIDDKIKLLGAEVAPAAVHPGDAFDLTLYWQASEPIAYNASLFVHLLGRENEVVDQLDTYPGWGNAATSLWPVGPVIVDRYRIPVGADVTPEQVLRVDVGLFDYATRASYPGQLASGAPPPLGVASVRVIPREPPQYSIEQPTDFNFDGRVRLAGFDAPAAAQPGDTVDVELFWEALAPVGEDLQVFVHVLDANGQQVAGFDGPARGGWWPTGAWEPGQTVRDAYAIPLPADLPPGEYSLVAGLYRLPAVERLPLAGPPDRTANRAARLTTINVQP